MQLSKENWLEEHNVRLLGSNVDAIDKAEDRELFREVMEEIGEPCVPSGIAEDLQTALDIAKEIGYPVIVRSCFYPRRQRWRESRRRKRNCASSRRMDWISPRLPRFWWRRASAGWKEIEFETMRDSMGNVIQICPMENLDPVGVHTRRQHRRRPGGDPGGPRNTRCCAPRRWPS